MLEIVALVLVILWVVGLVTSYPGGMAVHVLLAGAIVILVIRGLSRSRSRSMSEVSPAGILAIMTRKSREEP